MMVEVNRNAAKTAGRILGVRLNLDGGDREKIKLRLEIAKI